MAVRRYTKDDLLHLRNSPLVQKPENLPAIEQWLEYVYVDKESREKLRIPHSESQQPQQAQNATASRRQPQNKVMGADASPMGSFGAGTRPSLMPTRSHASRSGEDIALGPPRTMFPSSRNVSKPSDFGDKSGSSTAEATPSEDQEAPRSRFFGSDKPNRKSLHEKEGRDNRESWMGARERRALGGDDEHKPERPPRRDREQDGERRNGHSDKHDSRWSEKRQNGDRQGGWREREREKRDRDWDRGGRAEKEPEWMDEPAAPGEGDDLGLLGMPRNQEQFQRWKEAMSGKKPAAEDVDATLGEPAPTKDAPPPKQIAALKLEGIVDKSFGGWGDNKSSGNTPDSAPTPAKSAVGKGRGSRFASMFKEAQPKEDVPPPETNIQKAANEVAKGAAEDEAGFNRILQMLGDTGIGPQLTGVEGPSSPPPKTATNGMKQKSRFTGFFDQTTLKSPDRTQSPPGDGLNLPESEVSQGSRGLVEEPRDVFGGRLPEIQSNGQPTRALGASNPISPNPMPANGTRDHNPPTTRMTDLFEQPPSRGTATPDLNIQNLLASQRAQRPQQGQDKNSEFLLNLLQTKGSRPASQQARPDNSFPLWLDQPPPSMPEPHAPKPRAPPPPGLFEDQLLRNTRLEPQPLRPEQPMQSHDLPPQRGTSQRAPPPGFYDEQSLFLQQQQQQQAAQRRNFTEPPQHHQHQAGRRMSGHPNLPPMQIPASYQQQFIGGPPPAEFLQSPTAGQGPPPGFNPHMPRHPPGFNSIPNIFQQPQQQQQVREPAGFAGDMMGSRTMASPPIAPPGFYGGPQGMGPPGFNMGQIRSPNEGLPVGARGRGYEGTYEGVGRR